MPTAMGRAVERVRAAVRPGDDDRTDAGLLARYVTDADGEAFAALVRRHGPMVLAVCRRVTGDCHLADDAFQATFLVLARKAAGVGAVGRFLYGVAVRVALDARTVARRRWLRERPVAEVPDRAVEPPAFADAAAIDEELRRLPAKYRELLIACDLLGRPRAEVARSFRLPDGTLSSRLATARRMLAARLTARGLAPALAFAAVPVPAALAAAASRLAAGPAPAAVRSLARGALAMSVLTKLKWAAAVALLAAVAAGWPVAEAARRAPAKVGREPQLLVWSKGRAAVLRSDGTVAREWTGEQVPEAIDARLSPDGATIAVGRVYDTKTGEFVANAGGGAQLRGNKTWYYYRLTLYPVADTLVGTDIDTPGTSVECVYWAADGTLVVGTCDEDGSYAFVKPNRRYHTIDVRTKKATPADVPAGYTLADRSADGGRMLAYGPGDARPMSLIVAGAKPVPLPGLPPGSDARLSPDGKRVLVCGAEYAKPLKEAAPGVFAPPPPNEVTFFLDTFDLATAKRTPAVPLGVRESAFVARWSPDGKRLAYLSQVHPELNKPGRQERDVVVCDLGGGNRAVVRTIPLYDRVNIDWR